MSFPAKSILLRLFEIILGGLFIYAGCLKLLHPYEFAEAVLAYRLLPMALVGTADGKAAVTVAVTPDLVGRFSAADLAKAAVLAMGGQGAGGKPDFAQGGAPDAAQADAGLAAVRAALAG